MLQDRPQVGHGVHVAAADQNPSLEIARDIDVGKAAAKAAARLSSPTLAWALAVAADCRGDPSNAVAYVMAALERDPCSPSIIGSFRIITGHVRADLQRMDPRSPNVPSAFRLLAQMGEADASAFFKYSLHSEASGNEVAALTLAQVVMAA